jgi:hypothetical protein
MITYEVKQPAPNGDFLIGYATPGVPKSFTVAGVASNEQTARAEAARLNEAQVVDRRAGLVHASNFLQFDLQKES